MLNNLPEPLRKMFEVLLGQLSYASQRDAGQLDPDPRDSMCRQCGRMEMLELAALKLWIELLQLRGSPVLPIHGKS